MITWSTSRRRIALDRALVMAILNVTPDSFSDGGRITSVDDALRHAERFVAEGADIIDIGGESTRPGSGSVDPEEEVRRILPVSWEISKHFDIPVSIDTTKWQVAKMVMEHGGAEIINDISGLRWDARIAEVAAGFNAGLILMHSRGDFDKMHSQPPVEDILSEVGTGLRESVACANKWGVADDHIVLDVGIGFGKTPEQNFELIANLDKLVAEFPQFPFLVGASRKSFIGKLLADAPVERRLSGSLATAAISIWNGAKIVRVHDVNETVETVKILEALRKQL